MRRAWLTGCGLAVVILAGSSDLSAMSEVRATASGLLTHFYAVLTPRFEPGMLALAGSGILSLVGMAKRRRERQGLS